MGGYALYVWGSFGACVVADGRGTFAGRRRLNEVRQSLRRERLADELDHQSGTS
jgi:heme exporter protein D